MEYKPGRWIYGELWVDIILSWEGGELIRRIDEAGRDIDSLLGRMASSDY